MSLHNLARVTSATTGTGTLTLGSAVSGFLTFALAGVVDGEVVTYSIRDGSDSEIGIGTYTASGTTLSRDTVYNSTNSGAKINCSGSQEVFITAGRENFNYDKRWTRGSTPNSLDDEFNDGAIAGAWSRVDHSGHSGYVTWKEEADSLSLLLNNSADAAAELHAYLKSDAMSIGDYIQCHIIGFGAGSDYPSAGLIIADGNTYGAGNQAYHGYWLTNSVPFTLVSGTWTGFDTRASFTSLSSTFFGLEMHLRLKYSAANTFEFYASIDGISWVLTDTRAITMTPAYIGIAGTGYGSVVPFVFSFDYFRVNA